MVDTSLSEIITKKRKLLGLTVWQLAAFTELSIASIRRYEKGRVPAARSLEKLATVLGLSATDHSIFDRSFQLKTFQGRLGLAMLQSGQSQTSLSKCIGITQPEICYYLQGKVERPRPQHLQPLSYYTNVAYDWLLKGIGKMNVESPYPINDFWSTPGQRIVFLLWINNNLDPVNIQDDLGVSNSSLQYWIDDIRLPHADNVRELCKFFECESEWLVHYDSLDSQKKSFWLKHFRQKMERQVLLFNLNRPA